MKPRRLACTVVLVALGSFVAFWCVDFFWLESTSRWLQKQRGASRKSFDELRAKAEQGDANAEYQLGLRYYSGFSDGYIAENREEAMKWFQKAADLGNCDAQLWLAYAYKE